jgi:hypothetical protein
MHTATAVRQLLHVRQPPFVHPLPDQARIHPIETQDHELLLESLRGPSRAARGGRPEAGDEQRDQDASHKLLEEKNYNILQLVSW